MGGIQRDPNEFKKDDFLTIRFAAIICQYSYFFSFFLSFYSLFIPPLLSPYFILARNLPEGHSFSLYYYYYSLLFSHLKRAIVFFFH